MAFEVKQVKPGDALWPSTAELFPRAVQWRDDATDKGDYCFFAATDNRGVFLGGSVVAIGPLLFGPIAETLVGYLEDIEVLEAQRRKGIGVVAMQP